MLQAKTYIGSSYKDVIACEVQQLDYCNAYIRTIIGNDSVIYRHELVSYNTPIMQVVYNDPCGWTYPIPIITFSDMFNCSMTTIKHVGRFIERYTDLHYRDVKNAYNNYHDGYKACDGYIYYMDTDAIDGIICCAKPLQGDCSAFYSYLYDSCKH